jgi:hypothetical protein
VTHPFVWRERRGAGVSGDRPPRRHGPSAERVVLEELQRRQIPFVAGESVIEVDAQWAAPILEAIRSLEQPLILAFNRGSLMVLPQAIGKSTGSVRHCSR